jgi:hypothetical protein
MIRVLNTIISDLLAHLQQSAFRDVAGTRASVRVPVSEWLVNTLVAQALRDSTGPVKSVDVQPHDGDELSVIVTVRWPFVPPLTIGLTIERQPVFPESPILVLHWTLLGGLGAIASRFTAALDKLPPGIEVDGEFIVLDLPVLAKRSTRVAAVLGYVTNLQLHTDEGRIIVEAHLRV